MQSAFLKLGFKIIRGCKKKTLTAIPSSHQSKQNTCPSPLSSPSSSLVRKRKFRNLQRKRTTGWLFDASFLSEVVILSRIGSCRVVWFDFARGVDLTNKIVIKRSISRKVTGSQPWQTNHLVLADAQPISSLMSFNVI